MNEARPLSWAFRDGSHQTLQNGLETYLEEFCLSLLAHHFIEEPRPLLAESFKHVFGLFQA